MKWISIPKWINKVGEDLIKNIKIKEDYLG